MPAIDDPFSVAASLPGQMAEIRRVVKDLSVNRTQSPAGLAVGATGLTVLGPTALTGPLSVAGGVTGPVAATGALSGTSVAVTGAATSASVTTTAGATVGGDINVTGDLYTPHGRATPVVSGYVSAWLNVDGRLGATASTRASKRDLIPLTDITGIMSLTPYLGRYTWDADDSPLKVFLIAEDVQAAGFGQTRFNYLPANASGRACGAH